MLPHQWQKSVLASFSSIRLRSETCRFRKMAGEEETARMAALFWTTLDREGMGTKAMIAFWSHVFAPGGRGVEVAVVDDVPVAVDEEPLDVEVGAPPQGLT